MDFLLPYLGRPGRRDSLVGETLETVLKVMKAFRTNFDAEVVIARENRNPECDCCEEIIGRMSFALVKRMLSMWFHWERDAVAKRAKMECTIENMEGERRALVEARGRLEEEMRELRREKSTRAGADVTTSTREEDRRTEETTIAPHTGVNSELLRAIDEIVTRRFSELRDPPRMENPRNERVESPVCSPPSADEDTLARKVGSRARKRRESRRRQRSVGTSIGFPAPAPPTLMPSGTSEGGETGQGRTNPGAKRAAMKPEARTAGRKWPTPPKTTVVTLTIPPGETSTSYAEILATARKEVTLEKLGIPHLEMRRARTGAIILGVPGENAGEKANCLSERLRGVVAARGARVARPSRRLDLRMRSLDESVTTVEVVAAVAEVGKCRENEIRCSGSHGGSRVI